MAQPLHSLLLLAPLSGELLPLERVPDPVFSEKMLGEGIAVDPVSEVLLSPCDGTVTQLHASGHAVTVTSPQGVDVFMHIGLETVSLKGEGFTAKVAVGDRVRTGGALIAFDRSFLVEKGRNPLTIMVVTNADRIARYLPATGVVEAGKSEALRLVLADSAISDMATPCAGGDGTTVFKTLSVPNANGIHARPAAMIATSAKRFVSTISLARDGREADARSVVSLLLLDAKQHDDVAVRARGDDAQAAVQALSALIGSGFGEPVEKTVKEPVIPGARTPRAFDDPHVYAGLAASPGLVVGALMKVRRTENAIHEQGGEAVEEKSALDTALASAREELEAIHERLSEAGDTDKAAIFAAHRELLDDPEILADVTRGIDEGKSAGFAWSRAFSAAATALEIMDNKLLAGRAGDIRDVGRRVLRLLAGDSERAGGFAAVSGPVVLVADELTPSEVAALDAHVVRGFCTTGGSPVSHASLLARSLGMAAVAAVDARICDLAEGTSVLLDGDAGIVRANLDEASVSDAIKMGNRHAERRGKELEAAGEPAVTMDGMRIKVVANIGGVDEAGGAVAHGGEGVGVLRSEFLFLRRADPPSEEEQALAYTAIARHLGPERELVVRTLDVGGDKPLPYMPMPLEANPFLGVRGIRLSLAEPALLATQVRAIMRAAPLCRLHIMFPMVSEVTEIREAKAIVAREKTALGITAPVSVGIMVEVPATALLAENLAAEAEFFSIGTNDLTQYVMAADRGDARLSGMADALHPAVLRLVDMTVKGAHGQGRWAGVCGNIAADIDAVPVLLGLGVDELSVPVADIPAVKAAVRRQNMERCKVLAADALTMLTAPDVRAYLKACAAEEFSHS